MTEDNGGVDALLAEAEDLIPMASDDVLRWCARQVLARAEDLDRRAGKLRGLARQLRDELVTRWHDAPLESEPGMTPLHEHLEMTLEEYRLWAVTGAEPGRKAGQVRDWEEDPLARRVPAAGRAGSEPRPVRRLALSLEPRRVPSREVVPGPLAEPLAEWLREAAIEVVPGVWVALLGTGDVTVRDVSPPAVMRGAEIAVWDEREEGR